ncbi:MAG: cysteine peptidase family C39 domain-containing protein, partial [Cyclobacteriaceae bacterium]
MKWPKAKQIIAMFLNESRNFHRVESTIQSLLKILGIKATDTLIASVKNLPNYPSIRSISDFLKDINCNNLVVKLSLEQLRKIPLPAIAHLTKNNGHFVVLTEVTGNSISYVDSEIGLVKEDFAGFQKKWTGVALLIKTTERSGQANYKQERTKEKVGRFLTFTCLGLSLAVISIPIPYFSLKDGIVYAYKVVGTVIGVLLLQKQFGIGSNSIDNLCKLGNSDCDSVIQSKASKIFSVLNLSELNLLYFVGGLLSMIIDTTSISSVNGLIFGLSILSLPITCITMYHQAFILKKWCSLCLMITIILWLEFATHIVLGSNLFITSASAIVCFIGFSIPYVLWFALRERFINSMKIDKLEKNLNVFLRNESIFQNLLQQQPEIGTSLSLDIKPNDVPKPIELTIVTNPECGPCAVAQIILEDIAREYKDHIALKHRFFVGHDKKGGLSAKVVKHIISLSTCSREDAHAAISSWFRRNGDDDFVKWLEANA